MKSKDEKKKKGSETDKAIARPGIDLPREPLRENSSDVASDNILSEKDEVKKAEERLRQKNK